MTKKILIILELTLLTIILLASVYTSTQNNQSQGQIASGVTEYSQ